MSSCPGSVPSHPSPAGPPPPNILLPNIKGDLKIIGHWFSKIDEKMEGTSEGRRERHWELEWGWELKEDSLLRDGKFPFPSLPLGPGEMVCVAQTSVVGWLSMSRPRLWMCKRKSTRRMNLSLRSETPKPPMAVALPQRVVQRCQVNSSIWNKIFSLGKKVKSLEHTFQNGLQREDGTSWVVYLVSIPNGLYIVQIVYFQVTTVYWKLSLN